MKKFIVFIFSTALFHLTDAQIITNPFEIFTDCPTISGYGTISDFSYDFHTIKNGDILCLSTISQYLGIWDDNITAHEATGNKSPYLQKKSPQNKDLAFLSLFQSEEIKYSTFISYLDEIDGEEILWVMLSGFQGDEIDSTQTMLYKLDMSLNILEKNVFRLSIDGNTITPVVFKKSKYNDNFLVFGRIYEDLNIQNGISTLCEISKDGSIIYGKIKPDIPSIDFESCEFLELDSNTIIINPSYILNRNFDNIGSYPYVVNAKASYKQSNDSTFIFGGVNSKAFTIDSIPMFERVVEAHLNGNVDTLFEEIYESPPFGTSLPNGFKTIDYTNPNHIYFGTSRHQHGSLTSPNYVVLHSFSQDKTHHWTKIFGGDANYWLRNVVATEDLGCYVVAHKFYVDEIYQVATSDIVWTKFDKDGNVEVILPISEVKPPDFELELYPNPSQQSIQLKTEKDLGSFSFQAFNQEGKMVLNLNDLQQNEAIDIRELHSGQYFYLVSNASKGLFFSGEFVKM